MAEIETRKLLTEPMQDGWSYLYEIRRDDGELVTVKFDCTRSAQKTAEMQGNAEALASMKNYGGIDAVRIAEKVQSPSYRGATYVAAYFDVLSGGSLTWDVSYERPHPGFGQPE